MIKRSLESLLVERFAARKALIVLGPRQIGKTTLVKGLATHLKEGSSLYLNGDDATTRAILSDANLAELRRIIGTATMVIIDEAQRIRNAGLFLKQITDNLPEIQLIVTGSSALDLASEVNEPLTERKLEYHMYPVSWLELVDYQGYLPAVQTLEQRLIYGMYPEIITRPNEAILLLRNLTNSYLYKDLFNLQGVRKPDLLEKLVTALAWQIGHEVSYSELANKLQVSKETVSTYIDLLEKAFVVFRLPPFSRNLRNEITTSRKIYFYDTGIRNAVIDNFEPLSLRNDTGALWENFMIVERLKTNAYAERFRHAYFWRTHAQQEIDYVEEWGGKLFAYEFKWNPASKVKFPVSFTTNYEPDKTMVVTPASMMDFLNQA